MCEISWCEYPSLWTQCCPTTWENPCEFPGVEIPGLKGLGQHFSLGQVMMQGWVSAQVAQLGLTKSSAVLLEWEGQGPSRAAEGL